MIEKGCGGKEKRDVVVGGREAGRRKNFLYEKLLLPSQV